MTIGMTRFQRCKNNYFRAALTIVRWVTEPSASVEPKQHRRIQLLAAFLIIMTFNTLVSSIVLKNIRGNSWMVLLATSVALMLGYGVSRTKYWRAALILAITIPAIPPLTVALFKPPEVNLAAELMWLVMPLMVSSLLLKAWQTLVLTLFYMTFMVALKISNLIGFEDLAPVMGYLSVTAFVVIAISVIQRRDQSEIEYQMVELQRTEELLKENNEQLDTVLNSVPCGILVVDEETHIIQDVNIYATNLIGASAEETIGKECHRFICPAERGKCPVTDLGKSIDHSERVLINSRGNYIPILKNVARVTMGGSPYLLETFIDISERKKMEAARRESEEKFSKVFRSSPQEICITRVKDGKTIEINESFTRLTGYTREEIIGRTSEELGIWTGPGDREKMLSMIKENGRIHNEEFEFRIKSGEVRTQLFSAEPIIINGEECIVSIMTDITGRKRAEKLQSDEISVLTLLGKGAELSELLDAIVRLGESHNPSIKGSVLLFDSSKELLVPAAGPSLPDDYMEMLKNGVAIGPNMGACGTAAYLKERVIIPDIETSLLYPNKEVKEETVKQGLLACWSQPIIASSGELLGTIANYSDTKGEPGAADLRVIEWSARIAALAIERKKAEKALKESEERFSTAFHASPDAISLSRLSDGAFLEVNDSFTRITGYARAELTGKNANDFHLWVNDEQRESMLRKTRERIKMRNEELQIRSKSGEIRAMFFSTEYLTIGGERCLLVVGTDITERKRAEETIREREQRFSDIAGNAMEWIWEVDVNGKYTYSSPVVEKILGYQPEEMLEKHFYDLFLPEEREKLKKAAFKIFAQKQPIKDLINKNSRKDGKIVELLTSGVPVIDEEGKLQGYRGVDTDITERRRAEQALKESEERFSKAFHASPDAMSIFKSKDGTFLEINESFTRITGYTREEIIGHNAEEYNLWADTQERDNIYQKSQKLHRIHNEELQVRTKSGETRTLLVSIENVTISDESCLLVVGTDITERKGMEEALANEATRRRVLIGQSSDGIVVLDQNGGVYEANRRFAEMLGYSPEEVLKLHVWDWEFLFPVEQVKEMIRTVDEAGDHFTTRHRRKDGTTYDVEISTNGAMFGGQKLVFCVCRDVSERIRIEKALRESEEKFSKAFYNIPEAISISRLSDSIFVEVNESYCRVTGYTRDKIIGHKSRDLKLWVNINQRDDLIRRIKESGRVENEEIQFMVKSGETRTSLVSADIINISGEPCLLIISNDITERKRAEEKLKEALVNLERSSDQLAATNKELEAFSYSVSHDLRSPLRSIDGFSQALLEDYEKKLDETGRDYLRRLRSASQKMGELIDGILKLSRLSRSEMRHEPVDLSTLAREITGRLQETKPQRRVKWLITDDLTATADPQLMRVLLENLLGNAWKFTRKTPQAVIEFRADRNNGKQVYSVKDNGAGFDMAYVDKLFGAFQRLHNAKDFPGTGIGLATVQRIINRHGGTIWAEGEIDKGAAFHFTLE